MGEPFGWNRAITTSRGDVRVMGGSTPQKRPSYWKEMLGGNEGHLASWTKGCEGQKCSGGRDDGRRANAMGSRGTGVGGDGGLPYRPKTPPGGAVYRIR